MLPLCETVKYNAVRQGGSIVFSRFADCGRLRQQRVEHKREGDR